VLAVVVAVSVPAVGWAQAPEAVEWSQFQGGPAHPGQIDAGPDAPLRERWTFVAPDGEGLSGAVIAGGVAITVGRSAVTAVDLASGEVAWDVPRDGGPLSIPAVAEGPPSLLLFVDGPPETSGGASPSASAASPSGSPTETPAPGEGDDTEATSSLVAVDLADRSEVWRLALPAVSRSGVTVEGGTAYVGAQDGTVTAVDVADGTVRWSATAAEGTDAAEADADTACVAVQGTRVDASIAVSEGHVLASARDVTNGVAVVTSYAQDTGTCEWRVLPIVGSAAISAPAAGSGIVVAGFADRFVRALDAGDGTLVWEHLGLSLSLPPTSPAVGAEAVHVADLGGGLSRIRLADGEREWGFQFNEPVVRSSPVVSGEVVLLGLEDGTLVAVDGSSGHLLWRSRPLGAPLGPIALSSETAVVVTAEGHGRLTAFEYDPDGALTDVASPTVLEPVTTLTRAAAAAAVVVAVVCGPGLLLRRRSGDVSGDADGDEAIDDDLGEQVEEP
jgi:outer membrane protein assembly factor BamB